MNKSHHLPGLLLQTYVPESAKDPDLRARGTYATIDLDLEKYDVIRRRIEVEHQDIEHVAPRTNKPILLMGPTGAGKSKLAHRIYKLKLKKGQFKKEIFKTENCATLRGDQAMSKLFGHKKGAFTGVTENREGLLKAADGGMLFLDEIGELGLDEQAASPHFLATITGRATTCSISCNLHTSSARAVKKTPLPKPADTSTLPVDSR